jgi:hypothetical protein
MSDKITMGKLMELWEEAFKAGYAAHEEEPWVNATEAFEGWLQKELDKLKL